MHFIDLHAQQARIRPQIDAAISEVLNSGQYILGPKNLEFEAKLATFADASIALGCANGTDAMLLALMAWGIGPGDAVFCPSFTYCATAEVIALCGATPVFIDIDRETYNMDGQSLRTGIEQIIAQGSFTPKAVIAVDLFGQSANYPELTKTVREFDLKFIADSAQGFGSTFEDKHPLHWVDVQTTSFFPAKPLGCYGDGGAVLTHDADLASTMDSLRIHGKGVDKYDNIHIGINSRLDTLQAAILLEKLTIFDHEIVRRNQIADRFIAELNEHVHRVPHLDTRATSTWAQFTIEVDRPDAVAQHLREDGIPTARYYPKPVHKQTAYQGYPLAGNGLPNTMSAAQKVLSLPMHAYLNDKQIDRIVTSVKAALKP